jgi:hypothetical protein
MTSEALSLRALLVCVSICTQFTRFTGIRVQILTQKTLAGLVRGGSDDSLCSLADEYQESGEGRGQSGHPQARGGDPQARGAPAGDFRGTPSLLALLVHEHKY